MQLGNEASVEDILASIKRVIARDAPPPPVAPATVQPIREAERVEPAPAESPVAEHAPGAEPVDPAPLTSTATDDALRTSFSQLTAIAGLAQDGGAPMDAVVERMLRPMLAQWLDAHLPALVERLVREEIVRIAGPRG